MRVTYQDIINRLDNIEDHALRAVGDQEDVAHQVRVIITHAQGRVGAGAWRWDGSRRDEFVQIMDMQDELNAYNRGEDY